MPSWQPEILEVGSSKTKVLIFDDLPEEALYYARRLAYAAHYDTADTYYPGIRSKIDRSYVMKMVEPIYDQLYDLYDIPSNRAVKLKQAVFSLIDRDSSQLKMEQRIPHIDGVEPYAFAMLHYLNDGVHGATGFFRHRASGHELITQENEAQYFAQTSQEVSGRPRAAAYVDADDWQFECIGRVSYKANRLVLYPGNLLHSTLVNTGQDVDASPQTGRLTANVFISYS